MLPKRATVLACFLLTLFAFADLTVVVAVVVAPRQQYRAVGISLFVVLSVLTGTLAWRLWQRGRWAYWLALVVAVVLLPASVAANRAVLRRAIRASPASPPAS